MFRQVHSHCFEASERQFRPIQNFPQFASEVSVLTGPFEGEHMCRIGSFRVGCGVPNLHRSLFDSQQPILGRQALQLISEFQQLNHSLPPSPQQFVQAKHPELGDCRNDYQRRYRCPLLDVVLHEQLVFLIVQDRIDHTEIERLHLKVEVVRHQRQSPQTIPQMRFWLLSNISSGRLSLVFGPAQE